uniref:Periviscerokinin-1 n=1 Tax=Mantis religiosa TaxID=7507 RepID=PVK1_MANRE|nr:RecName: Full=Periviscerokinin-1; Short=Manre-PVK-1 [Mantis religiosa]
QGLISFPRV